MRALEFITEGRDAPLYHWMSDKKAANVFATNTMLAYWEHDVPGLGTLKGNSFSRNAALRHGLVRITVDQARLAQTNRMVPLEGEAIHRRKILNIMKRQFGQEPVPANEPLDDVQPGRRVRYPAGYPSSEYLAEEFVIGDIKNISRAITKIEIVNYNTPYGEQTTPENMAKLYYYVKTYAKKFNIPLSIDKMTEKKMISTLRSLKKDSADLTATGPDSFDTLRETDLLDKHTGTVDSIAKKHKVNVAYVQQQLKNGIKVELEHTSHHDIAKEIALDHLNEKPNYYELLAKVEK